MKRGNLLGADGRPVALGQEAGRTAAESNWVSRFAVQIGPSAP